MESEVQMKKLRRGESRRTPLGGNIADKPFPQALYKVAVAKGFESQNSLGRAMRKKDGEQVGKWYRGEHMPSPDQFGLLLMTIKPNDEELESLVVPYADYIQNIAGYLGNERRINISRKLVQSSDSPLGKWIETVSIEKKLTFINLTQTLGVSVSTRQYRESLGLNAISTILWKAPSKLALTKVEVEELSEAVAQTIERGIAKGHRYDGNIPGRKLKKIQESLPYKTFTGPEAGELLSRTRANISLLRKKFNLPQLLTEENIVLLRRFIETKGKSKSNKVEIA